ncbi:hypothetical protein MMC07_005632 [Pseudocyphellaria aurata]|nr:hypothetical protein [Pseudocyphellaria aurata]
MVKIGPPSPVLNTLDVLEDFTYAFTARETWRIINFFREEFRKPVNVDDLTPEDRKCDICTDEFTDASHRAVKLPCGHIFGMECIELWLTPFVSNRHEEDPSRGANTCPKCRRIFFPPQLALDEPNAVEARIKLWDLAYAHVGVALSDAERRVRADVLQYIAIGGRVDRTLPSDRVRPEYIGWISHVLYVTCQLLKDQPLTPLTPVQEHLRHGLEEIAVRGFLTRYNPDGLRFWRDIRGELFFDAQRGWDPVQSDDGDEDESEEQMEGDEVESEEQVEESVEDDTEELRFFRALFR